MTSVVNTMTSLSIKQVEQKELFDFRGMRLDWFRLQVSNYACYGRYQMFLRRDTESGDGRLSCAVVLLVTDSHASV